MKEFAGRHFVLIVENNSVPFDKRVWREAVALEEFGAKISLISPVQNTDKKLFETIQNIDIYRYHLPFAENSKIFYILEYFLAFIKTFYLLNKIFISKKIPDVVHVANPPDIFWPIAIYCKLFGIKFIFDEHDLSPETHLSKFNIKDSNRGIIDKVLRLFQFLSYKFSNVVISTNESYKNRAIAIYSKLKDRIFVVRNGPDIRHFHLVKYNQTIKKGKKYLFAYIGIMSYQDGVEYIIKAINHLIKNNILNDFILYLIGNGSDFNRLKDMVKYYEIEDYVIFTERISDKEALEILSASDICLSPDPYNQLNNHSTMNKMMEYMALSKPIVSFDLVENKYSAQEAAIYVKNNDFIEFANGIMKLVEDDDLRVKMGEFGKLRVEEFLCWEKQIPNLISSYKSIL